MFARRSMRKILLAITMTASSAAMATPVIINGGFETNNLSGFGSGYAYAGSVAASNWSFQGGAGLSHSATAWGGTAQEGNTFAFLQGSGAVISQSFTNTSNAFYNFAFYMEERPSNVGTTAPQTVTVQLDGITIWTGTVAAGWSQQNTSAYYAAAGTHTLSFVGTNLGNSPDTSAFIDNVTMSSTTVPEPLGLGLLGLGLVGLLGARRNKAR